MGARDQGSGSDSVWLAPPARRTGPPGLSRARIVEATVGLLDAEGLGAVSMRRVAAELGAGHMSLYWHVATKSALLELALDEVFGEVGRPPAHLPWPEQLRALAAALRAMFRDHPWATRLIGEYLNIGPNALGVTDSALGVVGRTGLGPGQVDSAAALVLEYVCGFATAEARMMSRGADERTFERLSDAVRSGLTELTSLKELADRDIGTPLQIRDRNFAFGVDCVIAGIQVLARADEGRDAGH
ncbi:TetR/AcrR family transcriptional regulator [Streptomyces sp. NBC_01803]|uniref:TetR/AcrR family transcriptional regulator n=1 Tax=Streptomyces sp. NBC_01803 TaxID=2975946 RepID=UPI002DDB8E73|nr:TetR/AcrR family transcriptional regulator [Streptomyces sp. NBC_01803]WSA43084.1 TetR/AcrR family transcriptional regulator [Streptomyces sp. NBC_01803]